MTQINVLGFGLMGEQICALLFLLGYHVNVWNRSTINEKSFSRRVRVLKKSLTNPVEGTLNQVAEISDLPDGLLTIETVCENLQIKREIYSEVQKNLPDAVYFSNTSSLSPVEIGNSVSAIHFFNPISLKLIELYCATEQAKTAILSLVSSLENCGFSVVDVNSNRGYIGNYILFHEISFALKLIEQCGYTSKQVQDVYSKLYGERDVLTIIDVIGVDVVNTILKNLKEDDDSFYLPYSLGAALDQGVLGKKNKTSIREVLKSES